MADTTLEFVLDLFEGQCGELEKPDIGYASAEKTVLALTIAQQTSVATYLACEIARVADENINGRRHNWKVVRQRMDSISQRMDQAAGVSRITFGLIRLANNKISGF